GGSAARSSPAPGRWPRSSVAQRTSVVAQGGVPERARAAFRGMFSPPDLRSSYTRAVSPSPGAGFLHVVHLRSAVCMLGRFPALAAADLDVEPGEIVLRAGANGAGKTTLLRLCAGLLPLR